MQAGLGSPPVAGRAEVGLCPGLWALTLGLQVLPSPPCLSSGLCCPALLGNCWRALEPFLASPVTWAPRGHRTPVAEGGGSSPLLSCRTGHPLLGAVVQSSVFSQTKRTRGWGGTWRGDCGQAWAASPDPPTLLLKSQRLREALRLCPGLVTHCAESRCKLAPPCLYRDSAPVPPQELPFQSQIRIMYLTEAHPLW